MKNTFILFLLLFVLLWCENDTTKESISDNNTWKEVNIVSWNIIPNKTWDINISTWNDIKQKTWNNNTVSSTEISFFKIENDQVFYKNQKIDWIDTKNIKTKWILLTDGKKKFLWNIELNFIKSNFDDLESYNILRTWIVKSLNHYDNYQFIADKNKIYYNFCPKDDYQNYNNYKADVLNYHWEFKYHSWFFMDSQNVYLYNRRYWDCAAWTSFTILNWVKPSNFKIVWDIIGIYWNSLYIWSHKIDWIDGSKFKFYKKIQYWWFLGDDKNLYFYSMWCSSDNCDLPKSNIIKINNIDISTFKFINILQPEEHDSFVPIVYYDKNWVYIIKFIHDDKYNRSYSLEKLDIQNPANFIWIQIDSPYSNYFDRLIWNDGSIIYYILAKNNNQDYSNNFEYRLSRNPWIDAPTFQYIKWWYAKDKNNFYYFDDDVYKLDWVDRDTFEVNLNWRAEDKKYIYEWINKKSK